MTSQLDFYGRDEKNKYLYKLIDNSIHIFLKYNQKHKINKY